MPALCVPTPSAATPPEPLAPIAVADGVFVLPGAAGEASAENGARTGNVAFIVGPGGVLVVESGVSYRHGEAIIAAVARVTAQPIRAVIVTHPRQEFVFGAAAFQARGIAVWMHRKSAELMAARCETCLRNLRRLLGDAAMQDTRIVVPDRLLDGDATLDLIGRRVRVLAGTWASAPGALALLDEPTATLIAGDAVLIERVPDLRDADLSGWQRMLARLGEIGCRRLIPGRGRIGRCDDIAAFGNYLSALEARVTQMLKDGIGLSEAAAAGALPDYAGWQRYGELHGANVQRVYLRRERDAFD
jgi:glyoxylase-like metal-dependent hydrolase (beta-lactamase superfamily II)